jgi:hypothetical protein
MSCPVCFGGDDPVVRESLNAGIGVLLGVTGVVLGCFAGFFVRLARRASNEAWPDFPETTWSEDQARPHGDR